MPETAGTPIDFLRDAGTHRWIAEVARTSTDPLILVAAALADTTQPHWLGRAAELATTTQARQTVAIAAAHLRGELDRVAALARDHLADHPDDALVRWMATHPPP